MVADHNFNFFSENQSVERLQIKNIFVLKKCLKKLPEK